MNIPSVLIKHDYEGEWTEVYINGKLIEENHRFSADKMCEMLANLGLIEFTSVSTEEEE